MNHELEILEQAWKDAFAALPLADNEGRTNWVMTHRWSSFPAEVHKALFHIALRSVVRESRPQLGIGLQCGGCPFCGGADGHRNITNQHYFYCDAHRTRWFAGRNLFGWKHENGEIWEKNLRLLENYVEVKPAYHWPPPKLADWYIKEIIDEALGRTGEGMDNLGLDELFPDEPFS